MMCLALAQANTMATRTFDQDRDTLPPLTKAISDTYGEPSRFAGRPFHPVFTTTAFSAMLDAIHALENRVIQLETP